MRTAEIFLVLFVIVSAKRPSFRIIGGQEAQEGTIPYIALINVRHPHTNVFQPICAGAILSPENILTNAVCASACNITYNCIVYVGHVDISSKSSGQEVTIKNTVWHETFFSLYLLRKDGKQSIIDLGVLHMEGIVFLSSVAAVHLAGRELVDGFNVEVAGFGGATMIHPDGSNELLAIGSFFTYSECTVEYSRFTRVFKYCGWIKKHLIETKSGNSDASGSTCRSSIINLAAALMIARILTFTL